MNGREFDVNDYDRAINCADNIWRDANNIKDVFDSIDRALNGLIGKDWNSSGAGMVEENYRRLRQNYDVFYNLVTRDCIHIKKVIAGYREQDAQAGTGAGTISASRM